MRRAELVVHEHGERPVAVVERAEPVRDPDHPVPCRRVAGRDDRLRDDAWLGANRRKGDCELLGPVMAFPSAAAVATAAAAPIVAATSARRVLRFTSPPCSMNSCAAILGSPAPAMGYGKVTVR